MRQGRTGEAEMLLRAWERPTYPCTDGAREGQASAPPPRASYLRGIVVALRKHARAIGKDRIHGLWEGSQHCSVQRLQRCCCGLGGNVTGSTGCRLRVQPDHVPCRRQAALRRCAAAWEDSRQACAASSCLCAGAAQQTLAHGQSQRHPFLPGHWLTAQPPQPDDESAA